LVVTENVTQMQSFYRPLVSSPLSITPDRLLVNDAEEMQINDAFRLLLSLADHSLADLLCKRLSAESYLVSVSEKPLVETLTACDLLIISGKQGIELGLLCRLRGLDIGLIAVTSDMTAVEELLSCGFDDFLQEPVNVDELMVRVRTLLKRRFPQSILKAGPFTIDSSIQSVKRDGVAIPLTYLEFLLLEYFLRNCSRVLTPEEIFEQVWSEQKRPNATLRTGIKTLRQKIDIAGQPSFIANVYGLGYKLNLPSIVPTR